MKHALQSAIKRGKQGRIRSFRYGKCVNISIDNVNTSPEKAKVGDKLQVSFDILNQAYETAALMVDVAIHFIKANGKATPKVFKIKAIELAPEQHIRLSKMVSLKPMTTHTLYDEVHNVAVIVHEKSISIGGFELKNSLFLEITTSNKRTKISLAHLLAF